MRYRLLSVLIQLAYLLQVLSLTSDSSHFVFFTLQRRHDDPGILRTTLFARFLGCSWELSWDCSVTVTSGLSTTNCWEALASCVPWLSFGRFPIVPCGAVASGLYCRGRPPTVSPFSVTFVTECSDMVGLGPDSTLYTPGRLRRDDRTGLVWLLN